VGRCDTVNARSLCWQLDWSLSRGAVEVDAELNAGNELDAGLELESQQACLYWRWDMVFRKRLWAVVWTDCIASIPYTRSSRTLLNG
jgi:hypothetical protein